MSDTADTTQASPTADTEQVYTTEHTTEADPVIAETFGVFEDEGIEINTSDPEYKALEAILNDPSGNIHKYRKELYKQIEAKRERLSQPAKPADPAYDPKTSARTFLERAHNPTSTAKPTATQPTPPTSGRAYLERAHSKGGK